jgi:hypothetical protein
MTHEPKCVQWKRAGAREVQALTDGMTAEQELAFWQAATRKLREKQHADEPEKHRFISKPAQRISLDRASEASRDLNRSLDEPGVEESRGGP